MNIYPYVYRLDHPVTGEFYIGYRSANKVPAEQDLGHKYFTSSKLIKPRFHEFNYQVLAEFFDDESAYIFEQELIHNQWKVEGMINASCYHGLNKFRNSHHDECTKIKISEAKKGIKHSEEHKLHNAEARKGRTYGPRSEETKQKMRDAWKHREGMSDATKKKISDTRKSSDKCRQASIDNLKKINLF